MDNILSIATFLPSVAAVILVLFLRGDDAISHLNAKRVALFATVMTLIVTLFVLAQFEAGNTGFQFVEESPWVLGVSYHMGVDAVSLVLVLLTAGLMPIVIGAAWTMAARVKEYMIALLVLETALIGAFCALDVVLLFSFIQAALLPMFLLIGIWGSGGQLANRFFLTMLFASLLLLIALIALATDAGTSDITLLLSHQFSDIGLKLLGYEIALKPFAFACLSFGCLILMGLWPFHRALPVGSTAGSIVLYALMIKLGGYGLLRFGLPQFAPQMAQVAGAMMWLSALSIFAASVGVLMAHNLKRMVAYTVLAHTGFVMAGLFSLTSIGVEGALFHMVSHSLILCALFVCVDMIRERSNLGEVEAFGGLLSQMPGFAFVLLFFLLANMGLPGTSGFVGEFLALLGLFSVSPWAGVLAACGMIGAAATALWMYRRIILGELIKESLKAYKDLSGREKWLLMPLMGAVFVFGVAPWLLTDLIAPWIDVTLAGGQ